MHYVKHLDCYSATLVCLLLNNIYIPQTIPLLPCSVVVRCGG